MIREDMLSLCDVIEVLGEFKFVPNATIVSDRDDDIQGLCDGNSREIMVRGGLFLPDRRRTIIHELLHAREFMEYQNTNERRIRRLENKTYEGLYGTRKI